MKKNFMALTLSAMILGTYAAHDADACTRIVWKTQDYGVFVSRTMDWMETTAPTADVRAAGHQYVGADRGDNKLTWTSKYASIGTTFYGVGIVEGFNDKGFSANALYLDEESTGEYDASRPQLENTRVVPFLIDNFATVEEAIAGISGVQLQQLTLGGETMTGHYSIQDASGDSAILEFIDGEWKIFHGEEHTVMTNSPVYPEHLKNWESAKPQTQAEVNGEFAIPGNVLSNQRYIRGRYMLEQLKQPSSYINGIAKLDGVTPKVPLDAAELEEDGQMRGYATEYNVAYNLDQKIMHIRYQFGDSFTQYSVDFNKLNDGRNYTLKMDQPDLFGDVTGRMRQADGVMKAYRL